MSLTLAIWILVVLALVVLSFKRPVLAAALCLVVFFASPDYWWWGTPLRGYRWSLYAGIFLLVVVLINRSFRPVERTHPPNVLSRRLQWIALAVFANATIVHLLLAPNLATSGHSFW